MKEKELFFPVKEFLHSIGCEEVYGEVALFDVLGLSGACNIGVELKKQLNFKLLDQAIERLNYVEYLYIAIPKRKTNLPYSVKLFLKQFNIGLLEVDKDWCNVVMPARYNRKSLKLRKELNYNIRRHIKDFHRFEVGGVKSGEGKTEYSVTIDNVKRFLRRYKNGNGATIEEILEHCETHYQNPKPSLVATLMAKWNSDWCEIVIEDGERYFRVKEN